MRVPAGEDARGNNQLEDDLVNVPVLGLAHCTGIAEHGRQFDVPAWRLARLRLPTSNGEHHAPSGRRGDQLTGRSSPSAARDWLTKVSGLGASK